MKKHKYKKNRRNGKQWEEHEDAIIIRMYPNECTQEEILTELPDRSWAQIRRRACTLGLKRFPKFSGSWSKEQVKKLFETFPNAPKEVVVEEVGRNWVSCQNKANDMGIPRSSYISIHLRNYTKTAEEHHRNMIRKYFGQTALEEHKDLQHKIHSGEAVNFAFQSW